MSLLFFIYRWATFALFIACNAIICSVAVWNVSYTEFYGRSLTIDSYLIFLGALGLLFMFPIIFVDIGRKGAITSRVWFELSWVALFWIMEFAGAVAASAILTSPAVCKPTLLTTPRAACVSARALVGFCWLCTILLLVYGILLFAISVMHHNEDIKVWNSGVREYPWFATRQCLHSAPGTPVMARFQQKPPSLVAPKPHRPPPIFVQQRGGPNPKYEIEHNSGPFANVPQLPPALPPAALLPTQDFRNPTIHYSEHLQSNAPRPTVRQEVTHHQPSFQQAPYQQPKRRPSMNAEPAPIRGWPRSIQDNDRPSKHQQVSTKARQKQRAATDPFEPAGVKALPAAPSAPTPAPETSVSESRSRPTGPRTRTASGSISRPRPPPLNLDNINNYTRGKASTRR